MLGLPSWCSRSTVVPDSQSFDADESECKTLGLPSASCCSCSRTGCCQPKKMEGRLHKLEITVRRVVVERRLKAAPVLRFVTGFRPELFVELVFKNQTTQVSPSQRSAAGRLCAEDEAPGCARTETWTWTPQPDCSGSSGRKRPVKPLRLEAPLDTELKLRVLGNHLGSRLLGEEEHFLGEVNFRMDDEIKTGMWPLLVGNRICGSILLDVAIRSTKDNHLSSQKMADPPAASLADKHSPSKKLEKEKKWKSEDMRVYAD